MLRVTEGPFITRTAVSKGDIETCDSCGRIIVGSDALFVEDAFITEHGLLCGECVSRMKPARIAQDDNTVWNERSY